MQTNEATRPFFAKFAHVVGNVIYTVYPKVKEINMIVKLKKQCRPASRFDLKSEYVPLLELNVLAIMRDYGRLLYLVRYGVPGTPDTLDWIEAKYCTILSNDRPKTWVEYRWNTFRPYIKGNKHFPEFCFRITYFCGPLTLLNSDTFLFESIETPTTATSLYEELTDSLTEIQKSKINTLGGAL